MTGAGLDDCDAGTVACICVGAAQAAAVAQAAAKMVNMPVVLSASNADNKKDMVDHLDRGGFKEGADVDADFVTLEKGSMPGRLAERKLTIIDQRQQNEMQLEGMFKKQKIIIIADEVHAGV